MNNDVSMTEEQNENLVDSKRTKKQRNLKK